MITEVFPEDAGTYTCEAFNDIGECFSSGSLAVDIPGEEVSSYLFTYLSIYLYPYPSIYLYKYLLPIYLSFFLSIYPVI